VCRLQSEFGIIVINTPELSTILAQNIPAMCKVRKLTSPLGPKLTAGFAGRLGRNRIKPEAALRKPKSKFLFPRNCASQNIFSSFRKRRFVNALRIALSSGSPSVMMVIRGI
jgi:hypothetical protein